MVAIWSGQASPLGSLLYFCFICSHCIRTVVTPTTDAPCVLSQGFGVFVSPLLALLYVSYTIAHFGRLIARTTVGGMIADWRRRAPVGTGKREGETTIGVF